MSVETELLKHGSQALENCSANNPILGLLIIFLMAAIVCLCSVIWVFWNDKKECEKIDREETNERFKAQAEAIIASQKVTSDNTQSNKDLTAQIQLLGQTINSLDCKRSR